MILKFKIFESNYDKLIDLENWYKEKRKEIDDIKEPKKFDLKSKQLFNIYQTQKRDILSKDNPLGYKGDINSKYLYHYTTSDNLIEILENNEMLSSGRGISFSTDSNLYKNGFTFWYPNKYNDGKHDGNIGIKIKLDFNKIKNDAIDFTLGSSDIGTHRGEYEIRVNDDIENIRKYIKEVIVFKEKDDMFNKSIKYLTKYNIKYKLVN